jgi:hypothetical protein
LPLNKAALDSSPSLAGFTDADGNFHISLEGVYRLNNSVTRGRVKCSFSIAQRVIYKPTSESCIPFMTEIAGLFQCKINYKSNNIITSVAGADSKHFIMLSHSLDKICYTMLLTTLHLVSEFLDYAI